MFSVANSSKGRGLKANENIESGTLILSEDPLYISQYPQNKIYFPACPLCLAPIQHINKYLKKMINADTEYEQCMEVTECVKCHLQYCCGDHMKQDATHKAFCGNTAFEDLMKWWTLVHGLPEWTTPELPLKIYFDLILKNENIEVAFKESKVSHFLHDIGSEKNEQDVLDHVTNAQYTRYLELCENAAHEGCFLLLGYPITFSSGCFRSIILACALNGQGCGTSPLDALRIMANFQDEVLEEISSELQIEYSEFTHCEGTAIYETHAMLNHSCNPNAQCQFTNLNERDHQDSKVEVIAIRNIEKGEEICISYNESKDKAAYNYEMYRFNCDCAECCIR
eukprot:NODE_410_length_9177_cov_0.515091.p4 type:complete len:339 gc:universal NODE_410_length_9177_cov_0.515091:2221-1205(-)